MPERSFDSGFWTNPYIQRLPKDAKLLYSYLWTNDHCNQAGLYRITFATIEFETQLSQTDLPNLFGILNERVSYFPEEHLIWVKNFLRHQAKSPKFIIAAIKCLNVLPLRDGLREEYETYNEEILSGTVPSDHSSPTKRESVIIRDNFRCQYCDKPIVDATDYELDHIVPVSRGGKSNYLNLVAACRNCNQKKLDKLPHEVNMIVPTAKSFHGAQATYILRNNPQVRESWLHFFPNRYAVIGSILSNNDQHPLILSNNDLHARTRARADLTCTDLTCTDNNMEGSGGEKGTPLDKNFANISQCYESNINILTPLVADQLKDIAIAYPPGWFEEAVKEAVSANVRNLKYITAILERWKVDGFKVNKKSKRTGSQNRKQGDKKYARLVER